MSDAVEGLSGGRSVTSDVANVLPIQPGLRHRHEGSMKSARPRKTHYENRPSSVTGHYHQGAHRQDMTAAEISTTLRRFWLKLYDPMEVLIMDQGADFSTDVPRGILPVVTDKEALQNAVEWQEALFKMAFERAVWELRRKPR